MSDKSTQPSIILKDIHSSNPCEFPHSLSEVGLIENPCNQDEILIFDGSVIYIYTKSTHTIKTQKHSLDYSVDKSAKHTNVIAGNDKNTVIIMWCRKSDNLDSFYGIFNCQRMEFAGGILEYSKAYKTGVRTNDYATAHRMSHFLVVFYQDTVDTIIYDILNQHSPKQICEFIGNSSIGLNRYNHCARNHIRIMYECTENNCKAKFLLFGDLFTVFEDSFFEVEIDIDTKSYDVNVNINEKDKDNIWLWQMNLDSKHKDINYTFVHSSLISSTYHWYKSRYLIIIGGYFGSGKLTYDGILCFDSKKKKWLWNENGHPICKLKKGLFGHRSLLIQEKDDLYLYVFGGVTTIIDGNPKSMNDIPEKICWKLRFTKKIDWKIERIIWIAYLKNNHEKNNATDNQLEVCHFSKLPKDIVTLVLSFVQHEFIFADTV